MLMHLNSWLEVPVIGVSHQPHIINGPKEVVFKLETPFVSSYHIHYCVISRVENIVMYIFVFFLVLIVFKYQSGKDSVVQVTKEDYDNCNAASPIAKYDDGHSMVKLNESGPHYFISGLVDNCKKNEKVVIVVMADRSHRSPPSSPPSPAPAGEESPSPPPAGEESQSPPPAPATEDNNPTASPNVATSIITSSVYSIIAFVGSSLVFVF